MPVKKEILYPVFIHAAMCSSDAFWVSVFEDLAYGIAPLGAYFEHATLRSRLKGREFTFEFNNKEADTVFEELQYILRIKFKLVSQVDHRKHRESFTKNLERTRRNGWTDIKKKNIRNLLIENYVIEIKYKYGLSSKQTQKLLQKIMLGFYFKLIRPSQVIYDPVKNRIVDLVDLDKPMMLHAKPIQVLEEDQTYLMREFWHKYLSMV